VDANLAAIYSNSDALLISRLVFVLHRSEFEHKPKARQLGFRGIISLLTSTMYIDIFST